MIKIKTKKTSYKIIKEDFENKKYVVITTEEEFKNENIINKKVPTLIYFIIKDLDGYYYRITYKSLKNNHKPNKFYKTNPYSIQNIKLWLILNNKPFELVSDIYLNSDKNKLKWKCLKENCGDIFYMCWDNILQNRGCSVCEGKQVGLSNCLATKNPELAKEWHPTLNGELTPNNITYGNDSISIWWKCSKNNKHNWIATVNSRINLHKINQCPYCSHKLPNEDYNLLIYDNVLCMEWNHNRNDKNPEEYLPFSSKAVWWKCKKCNYEWNSIINDRHKNGCPNCNNPSHGEKKVENILIELNIKFIKQYKFDNCRNIKILPFDFYLPDYDLLIEYQGIQHYEPIEHFGGEKTFKNQQKRDKIKKDYCNKNNIKLLEIPYWDFKNINDYLKLYLDELKGVI